MDGATGGARRGLFLESYGHFIDGAWVGGDSG